MMRREKKIIVIEIIGGQSLTTQPVNASNWRSEGFTCTADSMSEAEERDRSVKSDQENTLDRDNEGKAAKKLKVNFRLVSQPCTCQN